MRKISVLPVLLCSSVIAIAQTTVTTTGGSAGALPVFDGTSSVVPSNVTTNGQVVNVNGFVTAGTSAGGAFFTAHQLGAGYGYPRGMFEALTDNPTGSTNYYFRGVTDGTQRYAVRADGWVFGRGIDTFAGYLGNNVGDEIALLKAASGDNNWNQFIVKQLRHSALGNWEGASTRLQIVTDYTQQGYLEYNPAGGAYGLAFGSGGTEFARFLGDGRLGIGTTSPSDRLHVVGNVRLSQAGSGIIFPDGSTQTTAWSSSNPSTSLLDGSGIVTVKNPTGAEGIQLSAKEVAPGLYAQVIGQSFGTGGNLTLVGNPVSYTPDTGGVIFLGGSERGDGMKRKVWIAGNSQYGQPVNPGLQVDGQNNVGLGLIENATPGARLEVNGNIKLTAGSGASITFADGTVQSTAFGTTLCGGDYAESIDVSGRATAYEPGDVLVLDPANPEHFKKADTAYSTLVAGVYSTKPGVVGRHQTNAKSDAELPMAMIGIVPTKVSVMNGPVHVGDLLVTSGTPGVAMKGTETGRLVGAVIGKAMADVMEGTLIVNVLVNVQ